MRCRLLIFLLLCSVSFGQIVCLVGGSSSNGNYAGWLDLGQATIADADGGNGAAIDSYVSYSVDITDGGGGKIRITYAGIGSALTAEIGVNISFASVYASGRYFLTGYGTNYIDVNLDWISDSTQTISVWLGGAVPATYAAEVGDLEDVLDSPIGSASGNNVFILIYLASAYDVTEQIMIDVQGGSGAYRKTLRGVDSSYDPLSVGSYAEFTNTNNTPTGIDIFEISVENITLENIAATNPGGTGQPDSGESCFNVTSTGKEFVARNCRAINGYDGFYVGASSASLIDCVAYDNRNRQANMAAHGASVIGGYYEFNRNNSYSGVAVLNIVGIGGKIVEATIVGDATGISFSNYASHLVLNCNFIKQTTQAILVNSADAVLLAFNNIFKLADGSNDYEVTLTSGSMYSDYNISNVITSNTRLTGANDVANLIGMSDTSPWVNAAKNTDNYKLDRSDPLIAYALEAGWSPYSIAGLMGAQSIGAFPTYDLPAKTAVVAPDTVYGIEGTSAGGGVIIIRRQ